MVFWNSQWQYAENEKENRACAKHAESEEAAWCIKNFVYEPHPVIILR